MIQFDEKTSSIRVDIFDSKKCWSCVSLIVLEKNVGKGFLTENSRSVEDSLSTMDEAELPRGER